MPRLLSTSKPVPTIADMAARSIGSVTITIGLVTIPAKLFTATAKREVAFNRLERATGGRVKQPTVSSVDGRVLKHEDLVAGFEYTPDKFVTFEPDELKALELEGDPDRVRIVGLVPAATVDATHVTKSVFLGPNKGGERAYHLLASLLAHRGLVAIGQRGGRTRDELVVLAPHLSTEGLVMHECLYLDEVRTGTLTEVVPPGTPLSPEELELAGKLFDTLTRPSFRLAINAIADGGAARVKAAVDRKVAGQQIVVPPPREDAGPHVLIEQLRASVPVAARGASPKKATRRSSPASQVRQGRRASRAG